MNTISMLAGPSAVRCRSLAAKFEGGRLPSDRGAILLSEFANRADTHGPARARRWKIETAAARMIGIA